MKAVFYARYSSDNQREASIEGQIRGVYRLLPKRTGSQSCGTISTELFPLRRITGLNFRI